MKNIALKVKTTKKRNIEHNTSTMYTEKPSIENHPQNEILFQQPKKIYAFDKIYV
jgi:hypothetical protein